MSLIQSFRRVPRAATFVAVGLLGFALGAEPAIAQTNRQSILQITKSGPQPTTRKVRLGKNKSMIVDLPAPARDVMISNPDKVDAIMQTSTRAYLVGKDAGESTVFFTDKDGKQIAVLEIDVDRDLGGLADLLNQLIPGSKIKAQ